MPAYPTPRDRPGSEAAELLAVIAAVMTSGDIFRDRELLVWVANVPALSAAVHGYSHAPAMASLSHALHLLLVGLSAHPPVPAPPWEGEPCLHS